MRRQGGINDEDKKGVWVSKWMVQNTSSPQAAIVLAELAYLNQPALRGTDRMPFTERGGREWMVIPDAVLSDRIGLSEDGIYRARAALKKAKLIEVLIAKVDGVKCCLVRLTLPDVEVPEDDSHSAEPRNSRTADARNGSNRGTAEPFPFSEQDKENTSTEAERLCVLLADLVVENGSKRPKITPAWITEMDRMLRLDNRDPEKAERAIRWCQADDFWKGNIMSPAALRRNYDKLRLAAQRTNGNGRPPQPNPEAVWSDYSNAWVS